MKFWRTVAFIGWASSSSSVVQAIRHIQFASPLQALTIPEHDVVETPPTPRARYLQKIAAGLQAEQQVRDKLGEDDPIAVDTSQADWAQTATTNAKRQQLHKERMLEEAFDQAVAPVEAKFSKKQTSSSSSQYQFVGVIQPHDTSKVIQWYARPKPANSQWSVRLVHVNRDAIVHDLFRRGKIDLFGRYTNSGSKDPESGLPVVRRHYSVRERSWKNLWNFSPKHLFTDSSGMYWRERRLPEGLYTDGMNVYESTYRYRDGRNGMHRVSSFAQFLKSPTFPDKLKLKIQQKLKKDSPDIVLEE